MNKLAMMLSAYALPFAVFADGDPKSITPPAPPPVPVEAAPLPAPAAMAAPLPVMSSEVAPPPPVVTEPVRADGFGADTRYWVATQIAGTQSVTELRPMPGDVASHVYARYVKSFDYPIPETFKRETFGTGGSGGGSSSGGGGSSSSQ